MRQHVKQGLAKLADRVGVNRRKLSRSGWVVLMMHKINDQFDPLPLTLSPARFERMIEEIRRHSEIVSLADAIEEGAEPADGPLKFVLTFDDGYRDNYELALPIMERHQASATVYISVDHVDGTRAFWYESLIAAITDAAEDNLDVSDLGLGNFDLKGNKARIRATTALNHALKVFDTDTRERRVAAIVERLGRSSAGSGSAMLSWEMVRELAEKGISIGSHTMSHPILSHEDQPRIRTELRDSKARLEAILQRPVEAFAYPNGRYEDFNEMVVKEAKDAGYRHAVTTMPGFNSTTTDPFMLKRIEVHDRMCSDVRGGFSPTLFWANVFGMFKGYW